MAIQSPVISRLRADVRSGRNPRAWIPLSQELRRNNLHLEALTVCRDGLAADSASVAGVTEMVRVLADLGRYGDALGEIERIERRQLGSAARAHGLLRQKLWCQIRLLRAEEAAESLSDLEKVNPFDPSLNTLRTEVRRLAGLRPPKAARSPDDSGGMVSSEFVKVLRSQVQPHGKVLAVALVDRENKQSVVEGDEDIADVAARLEYEVAEACSDLGHGTPAYQLIEMTEILVVLVRKGEKTLVLATDPGINFGRLHHTVARMTQQYLSAGANDPGTETAEE